MGGTCSGHKRDKRIKFWTENLKGRDHYLEDLGVDGRIILE
jgi:hypothetical protein